MSRGGREEGTGSAVRGGDRLLMQLEPFCETLHSWCVVQLLQLSAGIQITYVQTSYFTPLIAAGSPGPQIEA